jgi:soluble lytic murein transglycosylase-like protein
VADSPGIRAHADPWYAARGAEETTENLINIDRAALRYDLDPDFVRAIVWMESTHGWYDRVDPKNKTIRPMNVHAKLWEQLGISRTDLDNPQLNIEAGVYILAQIWQRTEDPTCEKVATLYNQLGATAVNQYGKTIVGYMNQRPWVSSQEAVKKSQLKVWKNR